MKRKMAIKNKKIKFKSLSNKILKIVGISVAIAAIIPAVVSLVSMNSLISNIVEKQAVASVDIMKEELNNLSKTLKISAETIAFDQTMIDAILDKNATLILKESESLGESLGIDSIIVTDSEGFVLSRTHDTEKIGDDISNWNAIKSALSGEFYSGIETDTDFRYAVNAATSIFDNSGNLIGVVSTAYNLENNNFVDNLKGIMENEFTIFAGDERISTTIIDNGNRVVGTKLDSKIADIVINQKQNYTGKAKLFGKNYKTAYYPIISKDGSTVTGVLYSGRDNTDVEKSMLINIIIIAAAAVICVIIDISIVANTLKKRLALPLEKVVNAAKAIETGDINKNVMNSIAEITAKDEIGSLARSIEGAVNSVQMMSEDVGMFQKALFDHDLTVSADCSKHNGIYKATVETVGTLFSELTVVLNGIKIMSDGIDGGSSQVSGASQSLAQGATEQASATEELAATIEEISEQINENANSASFASSLSKETITEVEVSSNHMNEMMSAMSNMRNITNEISKIIKTIDDIAFQTNILALNAAVEAARAGVQGKGFAVVADEVRNLANKSADAAKSTALLIESSIEAVENGSKIAKTTEQALQNVVVKTNKVNEIVFEIADAAQKQSEGIMQIRTGVEQISDVVQTNSATAEETAAASEELAAQAQSLREMVDVYKTNVQNFCCEN